MTPSDVLAKLIDSAKGRLADEHHAPNPQEQRRQMRLYSAREAQRRREFR